MINPGGMVTWDNVDTVVHTTTSGSPADGPDGVFDSGMVMPGTSFSHTFDDLGVYDYFCMVHPWMTGKVTVTGDPVQPQTSLLTVPADQVFTTTNSTGTYTYGFDVSSDGYPTTCEYDTDYLGSSYGTTTHSRPHMEHQMDHWFVFPEGTTQVKCEFSVGSGMKDWSDGDWSDTASFTVTVNPDNTTPIETNIINISSFAVTSSCDDTKTCLDPYHAQVSLNQNVTWSATPFATVIVSGNPVSGPDGLFNFGFKTNEESVFMFNQTGTFQFFDMTHPWIAGNVTVTGGN